METAVRDEHAVSKFCEYLCIRTVAPNPDYESAIRFLSAYAEEIKLPFERLEPVPGYPIALMRWDGTDPSLPTVLLNSHTDVVPVVESLWTSDPWAGHRRSNGDIVGRGAQDMKCVGIQYLEAVRRLKAKGYRPRRTVFLTFVPDEELGGGKGMMPFLNTPRFAEMNVGFAMDEGLANPTDAFTLFYGERAPWWVRVIATGQPGHGSRFIENTAMEKLMVVIERFLAFRREQKALLDSGVATELGDVTTINLTMLKGGLQFNVVPPEAEAGFDIRIPPTVDLELFQKQLDEWTAIPGVSYEFVAKFENNQMTVLDDNNPWWIAFRAACDRIGAKIEARIFPAATDSRFIRQRGIPAFGFSPINHTPILLHDNDEFLNEGVFLRGIDVYCHVIPAIADVA